MATLTIRNLDDAIRDKLRLRAAQRGHSMEAEARAILEKAIKQSHPRPGDVMRRMHTRFAELSGVELELPERKAQREPIRFEE